MVTMCLRLGREALMTTEPEVREVRWSVGAPKRGGQGVAINRTRHVSAGRRGGHEARESSLTRAD